MDKQIAYSVLEIKSMDDKNGKRTFKGIASTPTADRMGDVVEPKGAEFKLPIPLLWQHDSREPIGWVHAAKVTAKGIEVEGEVAMIDEPGKLKDRLDEAWQSLKSKLVGGLSIGFKPIEYSQIDETYSYRFIKWLWLELSAVTIPANGDCSITTIKSADLAARRAASGAKAGDTVSRSASSNGYRPDVSGNKPSISQKDTQMKTLQEMIDTRAQKSERMSELMDLRETEKRQFTPEEAKEFDGLDDEISALDDDIRVKRFQERQAAGATAVHGKNADEATASRGGVSFVKKADPEDKYKGQGFTRLAIAKAASFMALKDGNFITPAQIAEQRWSKTHPNLVNWIKAAVAGGGTGSGEWGNELADSNTRYTGDFIEFLYSMTIFDRLPLRQVPARIHIKGQDGAATGYWVGESKGIPVSAQDFSDVELTPLKVGAISVCSKELIADSSPSAEMWIRDSIAQASAQRVDTTFLSSSAASAGVSPAGILNGLSPFAPSGADADAVRADLMSLYTGFLNAKNASGLVQIMTPSMAKALQLLRNSLGQREFPDIRADGGTLEGDQVFTGDNVTPGDWILLKPSDIWKIGDTGIEISMSDTATIEQDSAPAGAGDTPTAASATLMSLWQTEQVGFKVVRRINYAKRRSTAVTYLANAEYGGVVS
jgi:HK97 family phage prohead protease